jgi:3-deoxy-manno-octulosonate cytidylyltransferase (CMP-KDO synthetase)
MDATRRANMKAVIVIPARYASTRLPGKLLLSSAGKTLLQHTYECAKRASSAADVIIAADDVRIEAAAKGFGARVVMTDPALTSGSARVAAAAKYLDADIIVNVQGDEPEIDPVAIDRLIALQAQTGAFCSTLACPFPKKVSAADPSAVKAVLGKAVPFSHGAAHEALYFTRALAPYPRDILDPLAGEFHLHIGVYAFRADSLQSFASAPEGRLEKIERLEQLRILEMGERIVAGNVAAAAPGVDTAADFEAFNQRSEKIPGRT